MQLFSADPTIVLKIFKMLFWPPKVEKTTLKIFAEFLRSTFFSSTALTAQMAQTEFKFQNVAYWPTVYRTGLQRLSGIFYKFLICIWLTLYSTKNMFIDNFVWYFWIFYRTKGKQSFYLTENISNTTSKSILTALYYISPNRKIPYWAWSNH